MIQNYAEIQIARPPSVVFPYLVEPEKLKEWLGGLIDTTPLTEGGPRVGARSRETVAERGRIVVLDTEITAFVQDQLLAVDLEATMLKGTGIYQLHPTATGTRLTYEATTQFKGFMRLFGFLIKPSVQKKLDSDLAMLKKLAETAG